jgi:hypothetical protein
VADERDGEVAGEQRAETLDQSGAENHEAPEHREVRDARHRPLEKLALAEHLGEERAQPDAHAAGAAGLDRLAGTPEPVQRQDPPAGERERRRRQ